MNNNKNNKFLPISREDMSDRGIDRLDFICVTGDAYVDHPSFGIAIISRVIEAEGFSVGVISQPDCSENSNRSDFMKLGAPKYGFFVTSGNIDSMVANYTAAKKKRSDDAYSPGGKGGIRPDRAISVYCKIIKEIYPDMPVVIGGLEASLRRFAHYDYWSDKVMPSILVDSGADILVYGMGERQTVEIAKRLSNYEKASKITDIRGTCYLTSPENTPLKSAECPSFSLVCKSKEHYAKACKIQTEEQDEIRGRTVIQKHENNLKNNLMLVQNPPMKALSSSEMDKTYSLAYMRAYHPVYEKYGGVPAILEVEFSITHNRGCFGNCNFCSIALHQGRKITVRSADSVIAEARELTLKPNFKGYIHDVGGPTANFRKTSCEKQKEKGMCKIKNKKCLFPSPCSEMNIDHSEYLDILRKIRNIPKIKKVFIRSGIRYDYLMADKNDEFFRELVEHHISGQLKVAPEHCADIVLSHMGKPNIGIYKSFADKFKRITKNIGKEQYLVPYLMSSHPGSTLKEAVELALFLKNENIRPEQVQDFYPTPGTVSTCMFYTGIDPFTMQKVYVPKSEEEKAMQRALLQYFKPENKDIVAKALIKANRRDLIGNGPKYLINPPEWYRKQDNNIKAKKNKKNSRGSANSAKKNLKKTFNREDFKKK